MKKKWVNRSGAAVLMLVAAVLIAVALTAVIVVAAIGLGGIAGGGTTYRPPNLDQDGDGKEDPIIGYLYVNAVATLDNTQLFGEYKRYIGPISGELKTATPSAEFFNLDLWRHDEELKMKFYVTAPQFGFEYTGYDVEKMGTDDSHRFVETSMTPNDALAIRYHGSYQITCTLMDMSGFVIDIETTSVEV